MSEEILVSTFTAMRKKLIRMALRYLPNEDEAEDALQDAFIRLWPGRDRIETTEKAEAITTTTLRNLLIDNIRKRKIDTVPLDHEHDTENNTNDDDSIDRFRQVKKIIDSELTPLQNEILMTKEYRNETYEDIAHRLGMQTTAVRMQLSRARKKIRECYKKRNEK